ncbi:hypothetical protein [Haloferax prahovense]|uniref:hypothetical protein n=1 Tax=Haloferax prahovense TaxID=381852 RepID=UPI0012683B9B|nr:hypothetical protein [Haloferax prahovense]
MKAKAEVQNGSPTKSLGKTKDEFAMSGKDRSIDMNRTESVGVLLIGLGLIAGSIATTQGVANVILPSVFLIGIGIIVTVFGRYR